MDITKIFGSNVFNIKTMKEVLPKDTYKALMQTLTRGTPLKIEVADVVANAMKDWAIEKGATHYTHWFQPLTGSTAEKHDSFISPTEEGWVIMEFSGKQLIQGEPDASSFPSGGLRATFEARGYTAWDCTSPAFLKEDSAGNVTLCIPTAFYSYNGHALDKKTPLLRSMTALSKQALRVLKALGNTTSTKVTSTVGPEQEYFLVDKSYFSRRLDLLLCGRTIFGAPPPKGQELEDHYFGAIKDRVSMFMKDLDVELWKMGISSKTKHNEVAPGQFEMAPIFNTTNIAADHNQLVMETMQKVALRHDLVCLLYEKPFQGVNGSGKHNNWSLGTDDGMNLLEPGHTPHENLVFLVFLSALIQAVDTHAVALRASIANSGNDHRLGANEAPPAIVSIFLGDELTHIMDRISRDEAVDLKGKTFMTLGVDTMPDLPKDNTDRNRTSPFAFTGNKFEFRMVGSSSSISWPNTVLNTIAAEALDQIATRLESAEDATSEVARIVKDVVRKHGRIIFNGDNYSQDWVKEAAGRGLPNITSTVEALQCWHRADIAEIFERHGVLDREELESRYEIFLEQYAKQINVEAMTALDMVNTLYIPSVLEFVRTLAEAAAHLKSIGASFAVQKPLLEKVSGLLQSATGKLEKLEAETYKALSVEHACEKAEAYRDQVFPVLQELREDIDALETMVPRALWPVPTYADLLFRI